MGQAEVNLLLDSVILIDHFNGIDAASHAFQAALAQHHSLKLVTRNEKDFPPRRFPFVLIPYRL